MNRIWLEKGNSSSRGLSVVQTELENDVMDDGSSRRALRIPVNGFGSFIERLPLPPAREKRWPTIIYDVTAANESRATRVAESPLLATGRGWGHDVYITG